MNSGTRMRNRRVLVLGGSGGADFESLGAIFENLGTGAAINYKETDADSQLVIAMGSYHTILDCSNQGPEIIKSEGYPCHSCITLNSPVLKNADEHGLLVGFVKNMGDFIQDRIDYIKLNVNYGFFVPSPTGINLIQNLVEKNQIKAVVQEVFPFDDTWLTLNFLYLHALWHRLIFISSYTIAVLFAYTVFCHRGEATTITNAKVLAKR